jgi:hypothetical protein
MQTWRDFWQQTVRLLDPEYFSKCYQIIIDTIQVYGLRTHHFSSKSNLDSNTYDHTWDKRSSNEKKNKCFDGYIQI